VDGLQPNQAVDTTSTPTFSTVTVTDITPSVAGELTSKSYVDGLQPNQAVDTTSNVNFNTAIVTDITPSVAGELTSKSYVDSFQPTISTSFVPTITGASITVDSSMTKFVTYPAPINMVIFSMDLNYTKSGGGTSSSLKVSLPSTSTCSCAVTIGNISLLNLATTANLFANIPTSNVITFKQMTDTGAPSTLDGFSMSDGSGFMALAGHYFI
jgi:hypothetical protein